MMQQNCKSSQPRIQSDCENLTEDKIQTCYSIWAAKAFQEVTNKEKLECLKEAEKKKMEIKADIALNNECLEQAKLFGSTQHLRNSLDKNSATIMYDGGMKLFDLKLQEVITSAIQRVELKNICEINNIPEFVGSVKQLMTEVANCSEIVERLDELTKLKKEFKTKQIIDKNYKQLLYSKMVVAENLLTQYYLAQKKVPSKDITRSF